jgi:two-component system, LytTR family, sensor kinase
MTTPDTTTEEITAMDTRNPTAPPSAEGNPSTLRRYATICFASYVMWATLDTLVSVSAAIDSGLLRGQPIAWNNLFSWDLEDALVWALFTPMVFAASRKLPLQRENWFKPLLVHIPLGLVFACLGALWTILLHLAIPWGRAQTDEPFRVAVTSMFVSNIPRYFLFFAICTGVTYYQKYRDRELRSSQLETQLARAQLQALKMQLEPHFLFNVLNSIAALTRKDPASAEKMTVQLAELLRLTLDTVDLQEVPLKRELEFLECYVRIQQTRFQDRLTIRFDVHPEVVLAAVPHLILQPLVENAIRHGIGPRTTPATIEVQARRDNGRIVLEILDDGRGLPSKEAMVEGLGLKNTRARLRELYAYDYEFTCENRLPRGCQVRITIPFRRTAEATSPSRDLSGVDGGERTARPEMLRIP